MKLAMTYLCTLAALSVVAAAPAPAAKDGKARAKTAKALLDWAGWCAQNGAPELGRAALTEAGALGADTGGDTGGDISDALDAADETADAAAIARGKKVHGPKIAKAYDGLAGVSHDAAETVVFTGYRMRALHWDASKGRGKKIAKWIAKQEDVGLAARAIGSAWTAAANGDGAAAITSFVAKQSAGALLLVGSADHPLVAFVSLPKGWKPGRTYPVLVGVDGAGSGFAGYGRSSIGARGSRDVIGVYPMTLSNTNALNAKKYPHYTQAILDENAGVAERLKFDLAGVNAVLALLTQHMGADERVFLTGFSGGGQFTAGGGVRGAPGAGESGGPPVLLLTGENDKHRDFTHGNKDSPGIEPQTDNAEKALAELGYTHVERRMVKAGHSPLHAEVWKFIDEVTSAR